MTNKKIKSPSSLVDIDDIFDISQIPHLSSGGDTKPAKEKAATLPVSKTGKGASVSFEEVLIRDLVNAQTYIKQNGLEEDFNKFTEKYTKKKL